MDSSKGECFGKYKILSAIGAGGMGEVYLALDTELDRKVAIKFCTAICHLIKTPTSDFCVKHVPLQNSSIQISARFTKSRKLKIAVLS